MGSNKVEVDENDSNKHNLGTTHHIYVVSRKKRIPNLFAFFVKNNLYVSCSRDPTSNNQFRNCEIESLQKLNHLEQFLQVLLDRE